MSPVDSIQVEDCTGQRIRRIGRVDLLRCDCHELTVVGHDDWLSGLGVACREAPVRSRRKSRGSRRFAPAIVPAGNQYRCRGAAAEGVRRATGHDRPIGAGGGEIDHGSGVDHLVEVDIADGHLLKAGCDEPGIGKGCTAHFTWREGELPRWPSRNRARTPVER